MITSLFFIVPNVSLWTLEAPTFEKAFAAMMAHQIQPIEYHALYEILWECYQHPLNLNKASSDDLKKLGILNYNQINNFFIHLNKNGPLVSIYELQAIPEFDLKTIYLMVPFIQVDELYPMYPDTLYQLGLQGNKSSYYLICYERTLETKQGYKPDNKKDKIAYLVHPITLPRD